MNTSEPYHQPVLEALCAFVCDGTKEDKGQGPPAADIQAGVTVIGRRGPGEGVVDLAEAHIPKVGLPGADLSDAELFHADLRGAHPVQCRPVPRRPARRLCEPGPVGQGMRQ
jgi:hypothetical protein